VPTRSKTDLRKRDPAEYERRWHAARARQQGAQARSRAERREREEKQVRWTHGWRGALVAAFGVAKVLLVLAVWFGVSFLLWRYLGIGFDPCSLGPNQACPVP
jgi:hypothetical protein